MLYIIDKVSKGKYNMKMVYNKKHQHNYYERHKRDINKKRSAYQLRMRKLARLAIQSGLKLQGGE
jgi:primosomal protein N''